MKKRRTPRTPEKKLSNAAQRRTKSEFNFKQFFQNHPFPTLVVSINSLKILDMNTAARELFKFPTLALSSLHVIDVFTDGLPNEIFSPSTPEQHLLIKCRDGFNQEFFAEIQSYRIDWDEEIAQVLIIQKVWEKDFHTPGFSYSALPWKLLIEHSPDIVLTINSQAIITYMNKMPNSFPTAQFVGSSVFDFIHPSYKELLKEALHKVFDEGKYSRVELLAMSAPRQYHWFSGRIGPLRIGSDIPLAILSVTDISQQKEIEARLGLFRNLIDHSNDAFFVVDLQDEQILDVNERVSMDLGFLKEEIVDKPFIDIFPENEKERVKTLLNSILTQESITFESFFKRKNQSTFPVEINLKHIVLENTDYLLISARDVAMRRSVENELKDLQANILTILESTNDAIWSIDTNLRLLHGNSKFFEGVKEYYGTVPQVGKPIYECIPLERMPEFTEKWIDWYKRVLKGERFAVEDSYQINGKLGHFLISFNPIIKEGRISGATVFIKDITKRKETQKHIKASEEKWRSLVQNTPDYIYIVDREGTVKFINHSLPGLPRARIIGKSIYDFIPHEIRDSLENHIRSVFSDAIPISDEIAGLGPDGEVAWYLMRLIPIQEDDEVREAIVIKTDITERKYLEAELQETLEHLEALYNASPDMIFLHNEKGELVEVNDNVLKNYGYSREEIREIPPEQMMGKGYTMEMALEKIKSALQGEELDFEWVARKKSGEEFPVFVRLRRVEIRDADGKKRPYVLAIVRDITRQKMAEQKLRESEEKYRLLVENQTDLVVKVDREGRFLFVSRSYCEMFGKSESELLGKNFMPFVHPEDREKTSRALENLYKPPYRCYVEQRALTRFGWRWLAWMDTSVLDDEGNVVAIIGVGRDITPQKKAEQALVEKVNQLQALGEAVQMLIQTTGLKPLLENILSAAIHAIPKAEKGSILLYDDKYQKLRIEALYGYSDPRVIQSEFPITSGYSAKAVREKRPILVEDARENSEIRYEGDIEEILEIKSAIVTPLIVRGRVIGAIGVDNTKQKGAFTRADLDLLISFAAPAAVAIENARLYERLQLNAEKYRTLVEQAPEAIVVLDGETGNFMEANQNALQLYGFSFKELVQKKFHELSPQTQINGKTPGEFFKKIIQGTQSNGVFVSEWHIKNKRGESIPCEVRFMRLPSSEGLLLRGSLIDISFRKKAENAIQQFTKRITILQSIDRKILSSKSLTETAAIALKYIHQLIPYKRASILLFDWKEKIANILVIADQKGEPQTSNKTLPLKSFTNLDKFRRNEVVEVHDISKFNASNSIVKYVSHSGVHSLAIIPLYIDEQLYGTFNLGFGEKNGLSEEFVKIGKEVASQLSMAIQKSLLLKEIQHHATQLEAKVRERTRALAESESRYRQLIESPLIGIYQADEQGNITFVNNQLLNLVKSKTEDIMGHSLLEFIVPEQRAWVAHRLKRGKEKGVRRNILEVDLLRGDGNRITVLVAPAALRDLRGEFKGYIGALIDISQRKKLAQQLANKVESLQQITHELEKTNSELEAFVYSVSHDLRAPLRAMNGYARTLLEDYKDKLDPDALNYLDRIIRSAQRMDDLIQDLLAYSRLGRKKMEIETVDLNDVLRDVLNLLEREILKRNVDIQISSPLPLVKGNFKILNQVFYNLIHNAIKFVYPGQTPQVLIRVEDKGSFYRIWIEDNGVGISPEYQEKIFQVFERLYPIEIFPGTGIGLAIVKKGIEKMGGHVGVQSQPEKGSKFWVELIKNNT